MESTEKMEEQNLLEDTPQDLDLWDIEANVLKKWKKERFELDLYHLFSLDLEVFSIYYGYETPIQISIFDKFGNQHIFENSKNITLGYDELMYETPRSRTIIPFEDISSYKLTAPRRG
jgi:hypothetical protein